MLKLCSAPDAITHSIVGIDSTSRYGLPGRRRAPTACASTMPRLRLAHRQRGDRAEDAGDGGDVEGVAPAPVLQDPAAGAVGQAEPERQPEHPDRDRARALRGRKESPMSDVDAGEQVASPTPTPSRATISCAKLRATPETAVSRLQRKTPAARIFRRSFLSDSRPSGRPTTA